MCNNSVRDREVETEQLDRNIDDEQEKNKYRPGLYQGRAF